MKKRILLYLCIGSLFFSACGGKKDAQTTETAPTVEVTAPAETPEERAAEEEEPSQPTEKPSQSAEEPSQLTEVQQETVMLPPSAEVPQAETVTLSIECAEIFDHLEDFAAPELLPEGGTILSSKEVEIREGDTVFDVLLRTVQEEGIHMEYTTTPMYKSAYIEGIANIYEFDCGPLSGWIYKVNGESPGLGCSQIAVKDGDHIVFSYTCEGIAGGE